MSLIHIAGKSYELVLENKNGFNLEAFRNRYSEVLERYDYIVGDWGYNQLRLKGFFRDGHTKASKDTSLSYASDYINEYCNFGCAYFVLEKKIDSSIDQEQPEVDPLLEDLDQELLLGDIVYEKGQQSPKELKAEQPKRKQSDKPKQQDKHDGGAEKFFDKIANKSLKNKQKSKEQKGVKPHLQQQEEGLKSENNKPKRKSNRYRHFDKKKTNKEQVFASHE